MHWRNSRFQVLHFIVGKTHTPDEAYRVLMELREERQMAVDFAKVSDLRTQAKIAKANKIIKSSKIEWDVLEAQADLLDIENGKANSQACLDEAIRELTFIDLLLARVEPHRRYKDVPLYEANQMIQLDEWKYELMTRAENYIAAVGHIPADHFGTMRLHPGWEAEIQPRIIDVVKANQSQGRIPFVPMKTPIDELLLEFKEEQKLLGN